MEPRNSELQKLGVRPHDARQRRFRIVKLEERIAPGCHPNPHGKLVGHCCGYAGCR